jgi:hypothetical protein
MIGVPALIGRAANNPTPLIGDFRFSHNRSRWCSFISSRYFFIDRILSPAVGGSAWLDFFI